MKTTILKKIRNWIKHGKTRLIMQNTVNKDLQSMLLPLNLIPNIMLFPKYTIRKDLILSNSMLFKVAGFCATLIYTAGYTYRAYEAYIDESLIADYTVLYINTFFDAFFYFYGFFMNFVVSVIQTASNIEFVLSYQEVHDVFVNQTYFKNVIFRNWMSVIMIIIYYIITTFFSATTNSLIYLCFNDFVMIIIDTNIIYVTALLTLLSDKTILMNLEIKNLKNFNVGGENCKKLFKAYCDIIKCYNILVTSFQQYVSFLIVFILKELLNFCL